MIDYKKLKESGLYVEEYIFLMMLYDNVEWNIFTYQMGIIDIQQMIDNLEKQMWITSSDEGYVLRGKGRQLFEEEKDDVTGIILHLNERTGKNFNSKVASNRTLVSARLKEGYSPDEIKRVINVMVDKWQNTKMQIYLRPETLFNVTKFQTYVNESTVNTSWTNERV